METHKFKLNDLVKFQRNLIIKTSSTPIVALCPMIETVKTITYVVENENGWLPNEKRKTSFGLDPEKKYLFVQEEELELV
jgi:hypothetical protein